MGQTVTDQRSPRVAPGPGRAAAAPLRYADADPAAARDRAVTRAGGGESASAGSFPEAYFPVPGAYEPPG